MSEHRITFNGHFGKYFFTSLGLMILTLLTLGMAGPYWMYWSRKWFFEQLQVGGHRIVFRGSFGEYIVYMIGLGFLTIVTFGLAWPYAMYWSYKYFFTQMELVLGDSPPVTVHQQPVATPQPMAASPMLPFGAQVALPPEPAQKPVPVEASEPTPDEPGVREYQFTSPDND